MMSVSRVLMNRVGRLWESMKISEQKSRKCVLIMNGEDRI